MREELEEARERRFWGAVLRALGTSFVVLAVLGALSALGVLLGWSRHLLPCAVGLLAGIGISVAATGSARGRELTALVLGAVTLPALAAHLAAVGAGSDEAFGAYSARLVPFLAHAAGALAGGVTIAAVWRKPPPVPMRAADEAAAGEPAAEAASPPGPAAWVERPKTRAEPARAPTLGGATP